MELVLEIPKASVDYLGLSNEELVKCFFFDFCQSNNRSILHIFDPKPTYSLGGSQHI